MASICQPFNENVLHTNTHTHSRQLFLQPQHLTQILPRFCKWLALLARMCGGGWDCRSLQLSVRALSACAERTQPSSTGGTSISCLASSPCLASLISGHQAPWLLFPSWRGSLVLTGQGFRHAPVSLGALLLSQSALSEQRLCLVGF